jgi:D-amino peptidase
VKVFISFDMEGVAGIVDWSQCRPPGTPYEEGRRLLLGEVNAAIDGAMAAGATGIRRRCTGAPPTCPDGTSRCT